MSTNPYTELVRMKPGKLFLLEDRIPTNIERETLESTRRRYPKQIIELGSGSGGHLIELARRNPDSICIGFELRYKRAFRTIEKAERAGLDNLLILRADAGSFADLVEKGSVDALHVNFPDPWDKRRWHKKRLLQPEFLAIIRDVLKPGGVFSYKTDHEEYFNGVCESLEVLTGIRIVSRTRDMYVDEDMALNIPTEFEQLFRSQGLPVYRIAIEKLGSTF